MSRKQAVKSRPGSGRKAEAERKRDERAARRALAKERRNRTEPGAGGEEEFVSFANQLQALGLKLREVPGDGNCLFRALGDQLEGHSRNHLKHRQETVDYMIRQRDDFEPFVEDDIPFEKHVASLAKPGTFAGNDAIVAFARNHQMNVVIHQLNAPLWQIRGTDKANVRELHIAYRYGEHYDSVRRINDNSEAPAHLQTDDVNLIVQNLEAENYNIESAILAMVQMNQGKRNSQYLSLDEAEEKPEIYGRAQKQRGSIWEEGGSGNRIFGSQGLSESGNENNKTQTSSVGENKTSKSQPLKVTNKQKREQQRLEKKKRQEERHRQKVPENKSNNTDNNRSEADASAQVTLVKTFAALNI
ncbi:OTU domain-containing protein 3 isoform X3 [Petaurus breviceps papuanus]|uniref:OTU domain-containing protein 3 isoform X3 n=1 Tax=Petaurus breviceps papuanus TaxID=3040969 RepID=UPI0036D7AD63